MKRTILSLTLALAILGAPFASHAAPPTDTPCTIYLRHDATGGGAVNGPPTGYVGKLESIDKDWVCIKTDKKEVWIPVSTIQAIEFEP